MFWTQQIGIKRDSRSTETFLNQSALCIGSATARGSCTTLQSGWTLSQWRWTGICPLTPTNTPSRNQHNLWLNYTLLLPGMPMASPSHPQELRNFDSQDWAGAASKPPCWAVSGDRSVRNKNPSVLLSQSLPWTQRVTHVCNFLIPNNFFLRY